MLKSPVALPPAAAESAAAWASPIAETARRAGKLAPQLARLIEAEVFRLGWPVGHALGKEEELAARFGVSRTVLREALGITERDGVTRRQRGRSGGVCVAAPAQDSVVVTLGSFLNAAGMSEEQFSDCYGFLIALVYRMAASTCTETEVAAARTLVAQHLDTSSTEAVWRRIAQLHNHLLGMAKNRALLTFSAAMVYSGVERLFAASIHGDPQTALAYAQSVLAGTCRQLESIIAGDAEAAIADARRITASWEDFYQPGPRVPLTMEQATRIASSIGAIYHPGRPIKRADILARELHHAIRIGAYRDGDRLDSEPVLMQRYQVSRGVLREAIRALEQHAVVRTEEGRGGGLCVNTPDSAVVVRSLVLYFRFLGLRADELHEVAGAMEVAVVRAIVQRVKLSGAPVLQSLREILACRLEEATPARVQQHLEQIFTAFAESSGNPAFIALMAIMRAFLTTEIDDRRGTVTSAIDLAKYDDYLQQMLRVEKALEKGDGELALSGLTQARQTVFQMRVQARNPDKMLEFVYGDHK